MFQYSPILGHSSIWDLKYIYFFQNFNGSVNLVQNNTADSIMKKKKTKSLKSLSWIDGFQFLIERMWDCIEHKFYQC